MDGGETFLYQGGSVGGEMITNAVIKEGIQRIDDSAFERCRVLVRVSIPDSVTSIGENAFYECENLTMIAIPFGVSKIETRTFMNCRALEEIELPNSITSIGEAAFNGCESLRSIVIPKRVEEIGAAAFAYSGVEEFVVPNGIKVIPPYAFNECPSLQTMTLSSSVNKIGKAALDGCYNLENFVLTNGLPKLTKIQLDFSRFGVHGFDLISQLIVKSPNLEKLSLREVELKRTAESEMERLNDDDIPMLLQLVSACPSLRTLNVSRNNFTPKVFEMLETQNIPRHLRCLKIYKDSRRVHTGRSEPAIRANHLLRVLEANPKLGIWTHRFWDDLEHENVRHQLEMNRYGFRGFTVPDPLWPLLIERLVVLAMRKESESWYGDVSGKEIETGAPEIIYPLLCRHPEVFLRLRKKRKRASHER